MRISPKKSRLLHLDFMRGIFLCVIIIDHLQKFPGFFELFTGKGILWASAAEGFFFLSGILLGLVRGRREVARPMSTVTKKLWGRALLLYLWNIALTLFYTLLAMAFFDQVGIKPGYALPSSVVNLVRETLTFKYVYGWADFLQYYAAFIFISPLAIWLLRKKYWWLVLAISTIVWLKSGQNFYLSWQLLFFSGAVFGYYVEDIHTWFKGLKHDVQRRLRYLAVATAGITFIVSYVFVIGLSYAKNNADAGWLRFLPVKQLMELNEKLAPDFDKTSLGIGRVVVFYLWFFALYFIVKRFAWIYEKNKIGKAITMLGQNSLYVYIVHSLLVFSVSLVLPKSTGLIGNILIDVAVISAIVFLVRKRVFFAYIPR